jgi:predicted small lipoprotein YifL
MRTLIALLIAATITLAGAGLTACGQKGPLYLGPSKKSKVPQTTPQPSATPPQSPAQQPPSEPTSTSTSPAPS